MTDTVVSKNLYELLGNNHDEDSDKEPEPPVKVIDRTPARTDKRSAPREAPGAPANAAPRRGPGGNEGAYRDRNAGSANNRTKPTEDRTAGTYGGRGGRGGPRGGRGGPRQNDRHSRAVVGDADKQVAHGWGGETGEAERADEVAGEALAKADGKVALTEDGDAAPVNADGRTPEEEEQDNSVSYADYLIAQAEKASLSASATRKANEGTKEDKKWASASELKKTDDEEAFIAAAATKAKRARERKQKEIVEIDQRFVEQPSRDSGRGGRGRGDGPRRGGDRGERGNFRGERGAFRGPRGDGAPRGGRGGPRGGAPRTGGGAPRGGAAPINTEDQKAFPSLGA
ncbi:hypothetical protein VE00_05253 [Pseudogymnoascus sp. WSF 3629]|nr:hypothetical protein VE00_05253 [Pseudogymnoascus sp. WSF 3629]